MTTEPTLLVTDDDIMMGAARLATMILTAHRDHGPAFRDDVALAVERLASDTSRPVQVDIFPDVAHLVAITAISNAARRAGGAT